MDNYPRISVFTVLFGMPPVICLVIIASRANDMAMLVAASCLVVYCFIAGLSISNIESERCEIRKIIKNGKCFVGTVKKIIFINRVIKKSGTKIGKSYILEVEAETEYNKKETFYSLPIYASRKRKISSAARVYVWEGKSFVWHEKFRSKTNYTILDGTNNRKDEITYLRFFYFLIALSMNIYTLYELILYMRKL